MIYNENLDYKKLISFKNILMKNKRFDDFIEFACFLPYRLCKKLLNTFFNLIIGPKKNPLVHLDSWL